MKIKQWVSALAAASLLAVTGVANADTIVSTVGDKDGFGLGVAHGEGFEFDDIGFGDGDGTDEWQFETVSFTHNYAITGGDITSASLELFSGAWGLDEPAGLYLNGTFVGFLTMGDLSEPPYNIGVRDIFDLTPFANLLTGHDTFTILSHEFDGGVLDYSELTVQTGTVAAPVPEPSTYALLGLGLCGVVLRARRRGRAAVQSAA